jgi:hypothetical protein
VLAAKAAPWRYSALAQESIAAASGSLEDRNLAAASPMQVALDGVAGDRTAEEAFNLGPDVSDPQFRLCAGQNLDDRTADRAELPTSVRRNATSGLARCGWLIRA